MTRHLTDTPIARATGPGSRAIGPVGGARLVAPAVVLIVAVTGTALGAIVATSLGLLPLVGQPRLSIDGYATLAGDLRAAASESLLTAAGATLLAAVIGFTLASVIVRADRFVRLLIGLAVAVMTVPHLIGAVATDLLLSGVGVAQRWSGISAASWPELVGGRWALGHRARARLEGVGLHRLGGRRLDRAALRGPA